MCRDLSTQGAVAPLPTVDWNLLTNQSVSKADWSTAAQYAHQSIRIYDSYQNVYNLTYAGEAGEAPQVEAYQFLTGQANLQ